MSRFQYIRFFSVQALWLSLTIFVVCFFCLRFIALHSSPPGFFVDESSIGYNAWTILKTGKDEHGFFLPLYFQAFGDYKNPVFVYSVSLLFWILGPSIEVVRLAAALWGAGAIGVFGLFLYQAKASRWIVLTTLLIVLTNPWFFQLSRVAFEVAALPFFLCLATLAFFHLSSRQHLSTRHCWIWLLTFALSLALVFYSYTAGRILGPSLLIVGLAMLYKKIPLRFLVITGSIGLILLLPAIVWEALHPGALLARYQVVGLSNYTHSTREFISQAITNYVAHFLPHFLIGGGDGNLRHVPAPYGVVLFSSLPFYLAGIWAMWVKRREKMTYWTLCGLLISPIPSALTIQSPHALRSVGLIVFGWMLAWYGIHFLFSHTKLRILTAMWIIALIGESLLSSLTYFSSYTQAAGIWFDDTTVQLVQRGVQYPGPYFVSSKLYPGTYATVDFLRIVKTHTATPSGEKSIVFDPEKELSPGKGTFFLDGESCANIPLEFLTTATLQYSLGGNCVYTR